MIALFALLLLSARVVIVDDRISIPAGEWRALELGLEQKPGRVECKFQVVSQGAGVRVMLMSMADLQKMRDRAPYSVLDATSYVREGGFSYKVRRRGDYVIVLDNRFEGRGPAVVHLNVAVDFTPEPVVTPRYAPPQTRMIVVVLSMLFFLGVVTYFAKKFAG